MTRKTVIHISHVRLPDPRIERIACLEKKYMGHDPLIYIGGGKGKCFDIIIDYPKNIKSIGYRTRKQVAEFLDGVIKQYHADYVHVHDLFVAYPVLELGIDFIYNDHELHIIKNKDILSTYVSLHGIRRYLVRSGVMRYTRSIIERLYKYVFMKKAIRKITKAAKAIIVISPTMKRVYMEHFNATNIVLVPNFPIKSELPEDKVILNSLIHRAESKNITLVYTTGCFKCDLLGMIPYRDISDSIRIFSEMNNILIYVYSKDMANDEMMYYKNIIFKGYLTRDKLIKTLANYHAGILPFKPSLTHTVGGSNKAVEYLHAGLPVIMPNSYTGLLELLEDFKNLIFVYDKINKFKFNEIILSIKEFYKHYGIDIIKRAIPNIHEKLVMDNFINELRRAYSS